MGGKGEGYSLKTKTEPSNHHNDLFPLRLGARASWIFHGFAFQQLLEWSIFDWIRLQLELLQFLWIGLFGISSQSSDKQGKQTLLNPNPKDMNLHKPKVFCRLALRKYESLEVWQFHKYLLGSVAV